MAQKILSSIALTVAILTASNAYAGTYYNWIDANGQTHITQTPPPKNASSKKIIQTRNNTLPVVSANVVSTNAVSTSSSNTANQPTATSESQKAIDTANKKVEEANKRIQEANSTIDALNKQATDYGFRINQ